MSGTAEQLKCYKKQEIKIFGLPPEESIYWVGLKVPLVFR